MHGHAFKRVLKFAALMIHFDGGVLERSENKAGWDLLTAEPTSLKDKAYQNYIANDTRIIFVNRINAPLGIVLCSTIFISN